MRHHRGDKKAKNQPKLTETGSREGYRSPDLLVEAHLDFLFAGSAILGESQIIMRTEPYHWDEMKIASGAPPITLHDLLNPAKILGVSDSWILQPEDPWEITGYVHNVVFTCGAVAESDGTVKIYWGGADTVMCAGEANVSDLVALCLEHGRTAK
jgi:predicted GH43/DUF377 family glycosyl hydrolase